MDHSFPIGPSRHYSNPGSSQHYRISPVNLPGSIVNSANNNSNSNSSASQRQLYNSVSSSLFGPAGGGVLPHNIFGRAGNSSNYLSNTPVPPHNHFNFPLRSNSGSNRVSFTPGSNNGVHNSLVGGNGNRNHRNNTSQHSQNSTNSMNKPRYQSHQNSMNGSPSSQTNTSKQNIDNLNPGQSSKSNDGQEPQYRIFKRGDTLPGVSPIGGSMLRSSSNVNDSPDKMNILSGNNEGSMGPQAESSSSNEFNKSNPSVQFDKDDGSGLDLKEGNNEDSNKNSNQPNKTPVSLVRDIARCHGMTVEYRLTGEKGPPHSPTFTVVLHLGPSEEYIGQGSSIKRAQHAAASEALDKTSLSRPTARTQPKRPYGLAGKRPNWALLQLTSVAEDLKEPISIVQQPITIVDPFRRGDPPSVVSIHVGERIFTGEGSNFNAAKNMAAMIALKAMLKVKQEVELKKLAESGSLNGSGENGVSMENKSPISVVHEMAMKRGMTVKFEVAREEGPPHNKIFTVVCAMGGDECTAEGQGPTKQAAKKTASELMIEKMRDLPAPASSPQIGSLKSIQKGLLRQKSPRKKTSAPVVKDLEKQTVSPISRLIQIAHVRKYKEPEFNLIASSTNGPLTDDISSILRPLSERERRNIRKKKPSFTMEVIVGPHCSRGTGPNKKAAKKAAAEAALVELGYGPTAEETAAKEVAAAGNSNSEKTGTIVKQVKFASVDPSKGAKSTGTTPVDKSPTSSMTCGRQLAPGVLVLSSDSKDTKAGGSPIRNAAVAQEMAKVNSMSTSNIGVAAARDGADKLAYLAKLLNVPVSYSDFPKKNEYLSVVSLGTSPPHVAHGCGATLDEAQNTAALKILEELSDIGLDSIKSSEDN